ncbi:hypothetical protein JD969_00820 [Planctomycetota bacterium]|nr:hypothetical protein JD969_00820 [Planctomycetota bacterium]
MSTSSSALVSNEDKAAVLESYQKRNPIRVPVMLYTNPRTVLLNSDWNPEGYTFEQAATDPETQVKVLLQHELYRRTVIHKYTDDPVGLPDTWEIMLNMYNTYDAAYYGAPSIYLPEQVPDTEVILNEDNKHEIFKQDITKPFENSHVKQVLAFEKEMEAICKDMIFEGRPVKLKPWYWGWMDGPVTIAMNLRGSAFMEDLVLDPEYADKLMAFITEAAIIRRKAFEDHYGDRIDKINLLPDDSSVMLSNEMYCERVLPLHKKFFDSAGDDRTRLFHLCGDAMRLFPIICKELKLNIIDTGYPIDHGLLREQIGDDVEILGGPEVALIMDGTPDEVYERARAIITSGVKRGGRYVLKEGNNLPPNPLLDNLEAMYQAAIDFGGYDK